jgi:hypothetical protein
VPIVYKTDQGKFGESIDMLTFIRGAQKKPEGPQPGRLAPKEQVTELVFERQTRMQPLDGTPSKTVCVGLITCAAVLYVSTDSNAARGIWIHHAGSGAVWDADVDLALRNLRGRPESVSVVFAHLAKPDKGYDESMARMVRKGIKDNSIVEIPWLTFDMFGANYFGHLGF